MRKHKGGVLLYGECFSWSVLSHREGLVLASAGCSETQAYCDMDVAVEPTGMYLWRPADRTTSASDRQVSCANISDYVLS